MADHKIDEFIALLKKQFKIYLGISIAVFLFILFFLPFPAEKFEFDNRLLFIAGFGFITFLSLVIVQISFHRSLTLSVFRHTESSIVTYIYYFTLFALTSLAFVFYIRYVGQEKVTFHMMLRVIVICMSIPLVLNLNTFVSSTQEKNKKLLHEIALLQNTLKSHTESYLNTYIELISENEDDNFRIQISNILFIRSADNYVEVGYKDGTEVKKRLIRNTLKSVEQQLKEYNLFIRTHRTGLVNIQFVEKLHKNFSSYWLSLEGTLETIPVSRQYLLAVKSLF